MNDSEKGAPTSIVAAVVFLFWRSMLGRLILVIAVIVIAAFSFWNTLPEDTKKTVISSLITSGVKQNQVLAPLPISSKFTMVDIEPDYSRDLKSVLAEHARIAVSKRRKPYVYVYANWCVPCGKLRASLGNPLMEDAFDSTYIIMLNHEKWEKPLKGTDFDAPVFPTIYQITDKGVATERSITGGAWGKDVPEEMAPVLKEFFEKTFL